jgi:hypothetical protein
VRAMQRLRISDHSRGLGRGDASAIHRLLRWQPPGLARAAGEGDVVAATAARCAAAALQRERWKGSEHEGDAVRRARKHVRGQAV